MTDAKPSARPSVAAAMGRATRRQGTTSGILALAAALAAASLMAALVKVDGPINVVGNRFIDATPKWLKTFAINAFGTADKAALKTGILVLLVLAAAAIGRSASRRFVFAVAGSMALAVIGVVAALTRSGSQGLDWFPPVLGAAVGLGTFWVLLVRPLQARDRPGPSESPTAFDRRRFVSSAIALGATSGAMALVGAGVRRSTNRNITARASEKVASTGFPTPASPAAPAPPSASIGHGVAPYVPPSPDFYRIDTALSVPTVDVTSWKLKVQGMVDRPLTISYDDLLAMPMIERYVTLSCVSNEVGGNLVGNAKWLGVPLADVLREAGVRSQATQVASKSVDGWTCGFPTALALDGRDAMIAVSMNDEPLPRKHGFPARLVVPGLYGYVSATKWLSEINLTRIEDFDGYWIPRGWAKNAPVKTQSRIDVPADHATVMAGTVAVAGVAWAMRRGIEHVELKIDDGDWTRANLADEPSVDAWRQWVYEWDATPGRHSLAVRATDGTGDVQTGAPAPPDPDGATGWHTIRVTVK